MVRSSSSVEAAAAASPRKSTTGDKRLRRKSQRSSLYRAVVKEKARAAARQAAANLQFLQTDEAEESSLQESSASEAHSTELAVQRGSLRGMEEINDHVGFEGDDEFISTLDFDLTTITEDATTTNTATPRVELAAAPTPTPTQDKKIKKKKKKKPVRRLANKMFRGKKPASHPRTAHRKRLGSFEQLLTAKKKTHAHDDGAEAWMCGCCGKVFSSEKTAEVHEEKCINETLRRLTAGGTPAQLHKSVSAPLAEEEKDDEMPTKRRSVEFADVPGREDSHLSVASSPSAQLTHHRTNMRMLASGIDRRKRSMRRIHSDSEFQFSLPPIDEDLLLPQTIRQFIVLSDEALINAVRQAEKKMLSFDQIDADRELALLARDKAYYDGMSERAIARRKHPTEAFRAKGTGIMCKLQNKFVDAYQVIKEGDADGGGAVDQYNRKNKGTGGGGEDINHNDNTLYVNVIVKHSIGVVKNELERLAKERWVDTPTESVAKFERFRAMAHGNLVKLAGLALASDFTPHKVAVQLSNDLYRLIVPKLKRRGVLIETEIEYRVGPYFVLAVNVKSINWTKLMKFTHRNVTIRRQKWSQQQIQRRNSMPQDAAADGSDPSSSTVPSQESFHARFLKYCSILWHASEVEIVALFLYLLYFLHPIISIPICFIFYFTLSRSTIRRYVLNTVTDDIFSYVEQKGMEMEIQVVPARRQAAFMLSALREVREDSRELKKKRKETEAAGKGAILGPLLGPAIKFDKDAAQPPPGFEVPENLEYVGLEVDLPVGFRRLRWGVLSSKSAFLKDAVFADAAKYENITFEPWTHHDEHIGLPTLPAGVNSESFIGAERETSFLMPKSAFVKANMAYETNFLIAYNDYCFCIKKKTLTPDVPYGSTFIAWTQLTITNTGNNTCRLVCSVEAEFPNGPPMVGRQIKSGMRAGTAELFVLIGETIEKYADEFP